MNDSDTPRTDKEMHRIEDDDEKAYPEPYDTYLAMLEHARTLERELAEKDRLLRASVPERWKHATSPAGCVEGYIAELEDTINNLRAELQHLNESEHEMSDFLDGVPDSTEEPALDHMKRFVAERDAASAEVAKLRAIMKNTLK